jgi:O-methyltransferase
MTLLQRFQDQLIERRLTKLILPHTLVSPERIHNLYVLAKRIEDENVPGDVIECGVYKGGTAAILARTATHSKMGRTVWLFDSFQGMPPTTEVDGNAAKEWIGKLATTPEGVREVL